MNQKNAINYIRQHGNLTDLAQLVWLHKSRGSWKYRSLFLFLIVLTACGVAEPSPTLPPPPTLDTDAQPPTTVVEGTTAVPDTDARETAVAESSPTPLQTPTLAPTATPTQEPEPVINPAQMPAISHDLLFVNNGKLKRWQRDGQVVTLLGEDVVDYTLSADGRQAVVARLLTSTEISNTITAVTETIGTYDLNYVNLETGNTRTLVSDLNSNVHFPLTFSLAEDGNHLAFSGLGLGNPESIVLAEEPMTELYVMETASALMPKKVRDCVERCEGLVWHQDNNFFVFSDRDGLFLYNVAAKEPELLVSGDTGAAFNQRFRPLSWAKNGRWLMMFYSQYIEGAETAIFDVPTKQIMTVPNSGFYAGSFFPELTWMADDRIFLTRPENAETGPVWGETYRINQDEGRVVRDESVQLTAESMQPLAPMHWQNGRFGYGLFAGNHPDNGLYQRIAFNEPAERVSDLPVQMPREIVWAPDGSGAVMQAEGGMYYAAVDEALVDLETAVGLRGHNFTWLP